MTRLVLDEDRQRIGERAKLVAADVLRHLLGLPATQPHHIEDAVFLAIDKSMILHDSMLHRVPFQSQCVTQTGFDGVLKEQVECRIIQLFNKYIRESATLAIVDGNERSLPKTLAVRGNEI